MCVVGIDLTDQTIHILYVIRYRSMHVATSNLVRETYIHNSDDRLG